MADVRLTATNPEDSTVVPVACNAKGELLLEGGNNNIEGDLFVSGSAAVAGGTDISKADIDGLSVNSDGEVTIQRTSYANGIFKGYANNALSSQLTADGILLLGGSLPTDPNIELNGSGGGAKFKDTVFIDGPIGDSAVAAALFRSKSSLGRHPLVLFRNSNDENRAIIYSDGTLQSGDDYDGYSNVASGTHISADGNVTFQQVASSEANFINCVLGTQTPFRVKSNGSVSLSGSGGQGVDINANGTAVFTGDVTVGSRNKRWMIVESNGLAHLVEQTRSAEINTADLVDSDLTKYPPLRDIPGELTMVEQQLQKVLEKLRMIPEAGWEVWDGSD